MMKILLPLLSMFLTAGGFCASPVAPELIGTENLIVNGGAERGWYNIATVGKATAAMADDGLIYDGFGKVFSKENRYAIDGTEKHSGENSFRISSDPDSAGLFAFNSVPFIPGKPAAFSVWLKAKRETRVDLCLYLASGITCRKSFRVGTEWKKYELAIPRWGEKSPGISSEGDPVNGYGALYRQVVPEIDLRDGTIWADDAVYQLGVSRTVDPAPAAVSVGAKLNQVRGYYFPGEKISAALTIRSRKDEKVAAGWEATDFFGRKICAGNIGTFELKAGQTLDRTFELKLPSGQRGPVNWEFKVGKERCILYLGVIGRPGKGNPRLGVNYESRQNVGAAVAMLRDFGFGSVRIWSKFRTLPFQGFRDVPGFKNAGFYVMMCIANFLPYAPDWLAPVSLDPWKKLIGKQAEKVKGKVDAYEILNESNIWSGHAKNPDPAKFREMTLDVNLETIRAASEVIRKIDPQVKIAGPGSCHTDLVWTSNILARGGDRYLDIITEHPYRELPEQPDYGADLEKLHGFLNHDRPGYPVIASEAGERAVSFPRDNRICDNMRKRSAYNVRMMLIGLANGLKQYHHFSFDMSFSGLGSGWSMTRPGNPDNGELAVPAPVMYALRALSDHIGDAKPAGRVRLGDAFRCYLFDAGTHRVAVLWKWRGGPSNLELPAHSGIKVFDMAGTPVVSRRIPVSGYPMYLESSLPAEKLGALIQSGIGAGPEFPLAAELVIDSPERFGIKLRNLSGHAVAGKVAWIENGISRNFSAIAAESSATVGFAVMCPIGSTDRFIRIEVSTSDGKSRLFRFNLRAVLVPRVTAPLKIDGDLSDWPKSAVPLELTSANAVKLKGWKEADDRIGAKVRLAWDDDFLYLAVTADKPDYFENGVSASALWNGDGIQIAFDPLYNAHRETVGYQDDDYEFAAGLFHGKPVVYMRHAASASYDSVDKPLGVVSGVGCAIKTSASGTVYELAFPRLLVSPFRLQPDSTMRFNVILNVNNAGKRVGWLELTPGIGQQSKRPGLFFDLVLMKRTSP